MVNFTGLFLPKPLMIATIIAYKAELKWNPALQHPVIMVTFSSHEMRLHFSIRKPFQCSRHINRATNHISQPVQFCPIYTATSYLHDHSPVADFVCTDAQLFTSVNHCDVSVNTSLHFDQSKFDPTLLNTVIGQIFMAHW